MAVKISKKDFQTELLASFDTIVKKLELEDVKHVMHLRARIDIYMNNI